MNPSTDNLTLGKGIAYFNRLNPATGLHEGERDLGNAPSLTFNVALEVLEHFSSRGGLKAKDKKIVSQVTPKITFTLDEPSVENMAMLLMTDPVTQVQAADDNLSKALTGVKTDLYNDLGKFKIGIKALAYDTGSGAFTVGKTLTGATSGATATIVQVIGNATAGTLYLQNVVGTFEDGEILEDDAITPGTALSNGPVATLTTAVCAFKTATPTVFLVPTVDYTLDSSTGRIMFKSTGSVVSGDDVTVKFAALAYTYAKIEGIKNTQMEGIFRFVSDNPVGKNKHLIVWRLSLTPNGDTAFIGDDWSTLSFEGEVLKDQENHPESPYLDIYMDAV